MLLEACLLLGRLPAELGVPSSVKSSRGQTKPKCCQACLLLSAVRR